MSIHPDLLALRSNDAPQRFAQKALNGVVGDWRESARVERIAEELSRYGHGAGLVDLPALAGLFNPENTAGPALVQSLIDPLVAAQRANPLGEVPMRHALDDQAATLVLAQGGTAALVVQTLDPLAIARQRPAEQVVFTAGEMHERVLAGAGSATLVHLDAVMPDRAQLRRESCRILTGDCYHRDTGLVTRLIERLDAPLVLLRLQRQGRAGDLTREYDLADGRFIAQASARPRESRLELVAALLGRMGRSDAAPLLVAMAEEESGQSLRWQALKESLALDTASGFAALSRIAACSADPLSAPAGALRAQLIERHPQLGALC